MDASFILFVASAALIVIGISLFVVRRSGTSASTKSKTMAAPAAAPPSPALRDLRIADLAEHDGTVAGKDLWLAADGFVFNVEKGRDFYGPGSGYSGFAGRDATIGLATMETDPKKWSKSKVEELSAAEIDTLGNWVNRFRMKYDVVGFLNDGARPMTVAEAREKRLVQ